MDTTLHLKNAFEACIKRLTDSDLKCRSYSVKCDKLKNVCKTVIKRIGDRTVGCRLGIAKSSNGLKIPTLRMVHTLKFTIPCKPPFGNCTMKVTHLHEHGKGAQHQHGKKGERTDSPWGTSDASPHATLNTEPGHCNKHRRRKSTPKMCRRGRKGVVWLRRRFLRRNPSPTPAAPAPWVRGEKPRRTCFIVHQPSRFSGSFGIPRLL